MYCHAHPYWFVLCVVLSSLSSSLLLGDATPYLIDFLELNLPKGATLGVSESKLGNVLSEAAGLKVKSNETVLELLRGIRAHFTRFVKALKAADVQQAMLGLGHSYSRSKVKFNVHRVDNMIIQSSALLDQLDKDLNTFSMRVREWSVLHFDTQNAVKMQSSHRSASILVACHVYHSCPVLTFLLFLWFCVSDM